MTPDTVMAIFNQTLQVILIMLILVLMPALLIGLLVSMFQAATQINEMTLSFIPKLIVTVVVLMIGGPWMLGYLVDYTRRLIEEIPMIIG